MSHTTRSGKFMITVHTSCMCMCVGDTEWKRKNRGDYDLSVLWSLNYSLMSLAWTVVLRWTKTYLTSGSTSSHTVRHWMFPPITDPAVVIFPSLFPVFCDEEGDMCDTCDPLQFSCQRHEDRKIVKIEVFLPYSLSIESSVHRNIVHTTQRDSPPHPLLLTRYMSGTLIRFAVFLFLWSNICNTFICHESEHISNLIHECHM